MNKRLRSPDAFKKQFWHNMQTVGAVLITLVMLFPLYWMIITSLKTDAEIITTIPTFWPKNPNFQSYVFAWTHMDFPRLTLNTFYVTLWQMFIQLTTGILAAYGFARGNFPGKNALFLLVLSAMMIPAQVVFIPIYVLIAKLGWVDTMAGIVLPGVVSANMVFLLRNNFKSVDQSYLDAGKMDGLGILGTIWHVLIPMCKASVITTALVSFINGWNNYFWPKILSKSDSTRLMAVGIAKMKNMWEEMSTEGFYNSIMAGVVISIIPVVLIFAFNQKYMLKGYSKNAMK